MDCHSCRALNALLPAFALLQVLLEFRFTNSTRDSACELLCSVIKYKPKALVKRKLVPNVGPHPRHPALLLPLTLYCHGRRRMTADRNRHEAHCRL